MGRAENLPIRRVGRALAAGALVAAGSSPAAAVGFGEPSLPCAGVYDAAVSASLYLATVKLPAGGRLHFVRGREDQGRSKEGAPAACPSQAVACRLPAYLVTGNQVLVSSANDSFACVHYVAAPGKVTSGLVPTEALKFRSDGEDDSLDGPGGLGAWSMGDAGSITIKRGGDGYVLIDGGASRGPPSYNMGEIDGPAYLAADGHAAAGYTDAHYTGVEPAAAAPGDATPSAKGACRARLRRFGVFLVVDDNDHCGGQGVSFSGIYVKR